AVPGSADGHPTLHLVEVQRLRPLIAEGAMRGGARPGWHVPLGLYPGRGHLGDLLDLSRKDTIGDEEHVAIEARTLMPGDDICNDAGDHHRAVPLDLACRRHDVVELQIPVFGDRDVE